MFISLHFSVSSLCKVNQLKQTKLRIVMGNLYVPVQCELSFLLYWGEAHWSHCVIGGAFMPCSIHSSMVTNSIRCKCKGMFWLENSKCCCSIVSPLHHMSHSPETQFQGNPELIVCLTWALMSLSLSFALWVMLSPTANQPWAGVHTNNSIHINNCCYLSLSSLIWEQVVSNSC